METRLGKGAEEGVGRVVDQVPRVETRRPFAEISLFRVRNHERSGKPEAYLSLAAQLRAESRSGATGWVRHSSGVRKLIPSAELCFSRVTCNGFCGSMGFLAW